MGMRQTRSGHQRSTSSFTRLTRKLNTLYECRGYPQTSSSQVKPVPATTQKPWVKPKCRDTNL